MKKIVVGGFLLATLAVGAYVLSPTAAAQRGDRVPVPFGGDVLRLEGPGSSIGVTVRDQTGDAAGVLIESVREGSPATRAGLQKGDVVLEFDGERTRSARQFTRLVRETAPGRAVRMTVMREGAKRTVDVTPEPRDSITLQQFPGVAGDAWRALPRDFNFQFDPQDFFNEGFFRSNRRLGVAVVPLSDQLATYFGVKNGVLVSEVESNTPAATAGIQAGDVITAVNGQAVASSADLLRAVREAESGSTLEIRLTRNRKDLTVKAALPQRQQRRQPAAGTIPI
jgi:S1-C subfamily serine protease